MIITDTFSNLFSHLINNSKIKKYKITQLKSKNIINLLNILIKEGMIKGYKISLDNKIYIYLKYKNNEPVFKKIKRISKPGKRVYLKNKDLYFNSKIKNLSILSTSQGLLTHQQAKKLNVGGEWVCQIS